MVTVAVAGNISREATIPSGSILLKQRGGRDSNRITSN